MGDAAPGKGAVPVRLCEIPRLVLCDQLVPRISGVGLVVYFLIHIYTLSSLQTPAVYDGKMKLLAIPIVVFLAWLSCLPVVFHALNGGGSSCTSPSAAATTRPWSAGPSALPRCTRPSSVC